MSRFTCAMVAVVVLSVGAQTFGQGQVVSFHLINDTATATAPSGGLVLTDVSMHGDANVTISNGSTTVAQIQLRDVTSNQHHWNSGIKFEAGDEIGYTGSLSGITLSGYIPSPTVNGTIPAVGNVGLGIMVASLAAAGGWVLSRRKGMPA